jgi:nucleotide-binding universal stress UspA family protein
MAEKEDTFILLRNILVAVDTSAHSRAALEAAAALAKITQANIRGIFVQEKRWSQVSRLPSSTAINEWTGELVSLEEDNMQQQVERLKKRLQRQLQAISRQHKIKHSWQTAHGQVSEQILEAAKEADLITIGRRGRSFSGRNKLGSTAKAIIRKADKPILILKEGLRLRDTITVVYNATAQSREGLKMALGIAEKNESKLSILVLNESSQSGSERDKTVEKMVEGAAIPVNITLFQQPSIGQFLNVINYQQSGLLVIPKNQSFLKEKALEITLEHIHCPVLLIP